VFAVTYVGKLEDGTVFDRKGTNGEPFEFITMEGILQFTHHYFLQR
jgi:FKBP-type peptidyl-prolyl cis-trans isomerase